MEEIKWSDQLVPLEKSDECVVYQMKNQTGEGSITMYEVFPGVTLSYNDFHMGNFDSEFVIKRDVFCIDHCREGRLEYAAKEDSYSYVAAGDLKLDRRLTHSGHFEMPLFHYHGAMVSIDMERAVRSLPEEIRDFPVNLRKLQKKFCPDQYPVVLHNPQAIEHIFGELYTVPEKIKRPYFKIKILELLLYLEALELPELPAERPYFYKTQVEKVKAIQRFLAERPDQNITQEALAEKFQISQTSMKQCFKSVFGTSIGGWLLQYRMNRAAVMLRQERDVTIAEIAGRTGYDSPSKFSMAFRKVMGMSPSEYRRRQHR